MAADKETAPLVYTRRGFLKAGAAGAAGLGLNGCLGNASQPTRSLETIKETLGQITAQVDPTPPCGDEQERTVRNAEGPFYSQGPPERSVFVETDTPGIRLLLSGQVQTTSCQPVAGARLDFWHTDANGDYDNGDYDNATFRFRGWQTTDAGGSYRLETIFPGLYPGRTRHIHVKVNAPDGLVLTTQIYFAGEAGNSSDILIHPALIAPLTDQADGSKASSFDFILEPV